MREIKFRVWDEQFKRMSKKPEQIRLNIANGNVHGSRSGGNVETWRLMQYTGLKDKNGVEIYEGDLIEKDDDKFVRCGVVSFIHGCWMVASKSGERYFNLHWYLSQAEVIGNIHQHPELLEGDK